MLWFAVFGGAAFAAAGSMSADQLNAVVASPETAPFFVFDTLPLTMVLSVIALITLFGFFVTSANSATYVLSMLTSDGEIHPPTMKKVLWGVLLSLVAFAFIVSGGVRGIQTVAIIISFPFFFIIIAMCISMVIAIHKEHHGTLDAEALASAKGEAGAESA